MVSRRWRFWVILVSGIGLLGLALCTSLLLYRQNGFDRLEHLQHQRQSAGKIATLGEFIDHLPTIDRDSQEQWHAWTEAAHPGIQILPDVEKEWHQWTAGLGPPPEKIMKFVSDRAPHMEAGLRLLAGPTLTATAAGFLRIDITSENPEILEVNACRMADMLSIRELAQWLRWKSGLEADPTHALNQLDLLTERCQPAVTTLDGMTTLVVAQLRDLAYLENIYRGRLKPTQATAWIDHAIDLPRMLGHCLQGEALLFTIATTNEFRNPFFFPEAPSFLPMTWSERASLWFHGPRDGAAIYETAMTLGDSLMDRGTAQARIMDPSTLGPQGRIYYPNIRESVITMWEFESFQRSSRAFAKLVQRTADDLPEDAREAEMDPILGPSLNPIRGLHLRYERLGPERIRICVKSDSPLPAAYDGSRLTRFARFDGSSANNGKILILGRTGGVEGDLCALPHSHDVHGTPATK